MEGKDCKIALVRVWIGFIDGFDGEHIWGWAKCINEESFQDIQLFVNDLCVCNKLSCAIYREDLFKAGLGTGRYAFNFLTNNTVKENKGLIEIYDPDSRKLIAKFCYNLLSSLDIDKLISRAEALFGLGYKYESAECYMAGWERSLDTKYKEKAYEIISQLQIVPEYDSLLYAKAEESGNISIEIANLPLTNSKLSRKDALYQSFNRYFYLDPAKFTPAQLRHYLGIFSGLLISARNKKMEILYNNFLENFIFSYLEYPKVKTRTFPILNEKLCVIAGSPIKLAHILPVLQKLPNELLSFIFIYTSANAKEFLSSAGIYPMSIKHGIKEIANYNILIFDQMYFHDLEKVNLNGKLAIVYSHGVERDMYRYRQANLCICSSEFQYDISDKALLAPCNKNSIAYIEKIDPEYKTEFVYSGPMHLTAYLSHDKEKKTKALIELNNKLGMEIVRDRPVVAFFEDAYGLPSHITYCLNRIVNFCTVIVKPFDNAKANYISRLSGDIIIYKDPAWTPNDLRFASDWIMCGYRSSTFASSIMLGLNVIPYYSRIVKCKFANYATTTWSEFMPSFQSHIHHQVDIILRQKWHKYFDLLDVNSIIKAIFDKDYKIFLKNELSKLQKEIFGEYSMEDSSDYLAESILKFACNGTLGKDASAIYFKDSFFK